MKTSKTCTAANASPTSQEVRELLPLVHQVAARMLRRLPPNVLRDDLVAAGTFGLVEALRKNAERGPAFEFYARLRIRGAMLDELRSQDWLSRRQRARATQAKAEGAVAAGVIGFDDISEGALENMADASAADPHTLAERRCERSTLARVVAQLPEREGNIVRWHYLEDVPFKEIAARLGVSEPRVSQLHSRAIGTMRATIAAESDAAA
ncbi:MAG TPA: sigma-70 family RNA polymerase sigma factor [Polyangiaceae bacterium]|jgi:RNA polymerase sigma factor for flagellar operon FliA